MFAVMWFKVKWINKWIDIYNRTEKAVRLSLRNEKTVGYEGDGDTNGGRRTWNGPQRLEKRTGRVGNRRTNPDYPYYPDNSIVKIG